MNREYREGGGGGGSSGRRSRGQLLRVIGMEWNGGSDVCEQRKATRRVVKW